jgi:hypothetical protein
MKKIKSNDDVNDDERASVSRTLIEHFYRQEICVEVIDLDRRGAYRNEIRMLDLLQQPGLIAARDVGIGEIGARREEAVIVDEHKRSTFLAEILRSADVFRDGNFVVDCLIVKSSLATFVACVQAQKAIFENYFGRAMNSDLDKNPVRQLNFFLGFIGQKLVKEKTKKGPDDTKIYIYKLDDVKVTQSKEILDRQKTIPNGWEFLGIDDVEVQNYEDEDDLLAA